MQMHAVARPAAGGQAGTCTKVVAESLVMVSGTRVGRAMHARMSGMQAWMSRLPCSVNTFCCVDQAALATCWRASAMQSEMAGTRLVSSADICAARRGGAVGR
jgi:hypothetical protein